MRLFIHVAFVISAATLLIISDADARRGKRTGRDSKTVVQTIDFGDEMAGFEVDGDLRDDAAEGEGSAGETQRLDFGEELEEFGLDDERADDSGFGVEASAQNTDFLFRGWSKTTGWVGITPPNYDNEPLASTVPYRRYGMQENLLLSSRYSRSRRFEVVTTALLRYNVQLPEPSVGDATVQGRNTTSHEFEASLRDAYLGVFRGDVDFRVGLQRIPWGNSDGFAVNDVVNAHDRRDPTLTESEAVNIPTFAARLDYDMGSSTVLQLVLSPFFTSDRVDVYGTRWALVQADAPLSYRRLLGSAWDGLPAGVRQQVQPLLQSTDQPVSDFSSASAGVAFKKTGSDGDLSLYYHFGYDTNPNLQVDPQFALLIENLDPEQVTGAMLDAVIDSVEAMDIEPVTARYVRRHHVGVDAQTVSGPFVLRFDGAYDSKKVFTDKQLNGVVRPALQAAFGIEYQTGDFDKTILIEAHYLRIEDAPEDGTLLGASAENYSVSGLLRWPIGRGVQFESRGVVEHRPLSYTLRSELQWKNDSMVIAAGVLVIGGSEGSIGNYYRRNQSAFTSMKVTF